MTRKTLYLIGVIALILVGLYLIFASRTGEVESETNLYSRAEYGITFEVPDGYRVMEMSYGASNRHSIILSKADISTIPEGSEGPTAISFDIFTEPSSETIEGWVRDNNISNFNLNGGSFERVSVDDTSAISYNWDGLYRGRSIAFIHRDNVVIVSGTYLEEGDDVYLAFDRVVSSIRLR
jgi:hypothetical protein